MGGSLKCRAQATAQSFRWKDEAWNKFDQKTSERLSLWKLV